MKSFVARITTLALALALLMAIAPKAQAQSAGQEQKLQALTKQLNVSPKQEKKLMPILEADAPKIQAIKDNPSMSGPQKLEQIKAIHAQSAPQVQAILKPQQYEQLQQIQKAEIQEAMEKKMSQ